MNTAMFELGPVGRAAGFQREQIRDIVKEKNQTNPFVIQRINQTSKTGFDDRTTL
jgi:hypothetical protein